MAFINLKMTRNRSIGVLLAAIGILSSPVCSAYWGAVGHNDHSDMEHEYPYVKNSLDEQMRLLRASKMTWYRTSCQSTNCAALISAAAAHGINILKSLGIKPDADMDEAANYSRAYTFAVAQGAKYNYAFKFFEASNELDNWVGMVGDGSARSQYSQARYLQARGTIRGLVDGLHAANSSAKVVVDDAGWCHYGFLQMLWEDGVRWDVTGFHWYSDQGNIEHAGCNNANVLAKHAAFGPPVWITEFNYKVSHATPDANGTAAWMGEFIAQLQSVASTYKLQVAFAYELFDESNLSGPNGHYGIYTSDAVAKYSIASMIK